MFGLRFLHGEAAKTGLFGGSGDPKDEKPHFFFWPEIGYSSGPDNYGALAASVHYGTLVGVSGGPFVSGLLSGQFDGGIRSGIRASFFANLFSAEIAHQYVDKNPRGEHGIRAAASVDLFGAGLLFLLIGAPACVVGGIVSAIVREAE